MWEVTVTRLSNDGEHIYHCKSFTNKHSNILCLHDVDNVEGSITLINLAAVFDVDMRVIEDAC